MKGPAWGVDLLGIGHPLIDALIDYCKCEDFVGDILIAGMVSDNRTMAITSVRYLFMIDFDDGTKREIYKEFLLTGNPEVDDIRNLASAHIFTTTENHPHSDIKSQLAMLTKNYEAVIRSENDRVVNVRASCVGLMLFPQLLSSF